MLPRNFVYGLAALALACILGGVVALQRFAKLEAETQGPSVIAVGADGAVLLGARHELFLVQRDKQAERIALAELGLGGPIVAVGWDGKDWFVGDDASGTVYRCDLAARRCSAALAPSAERWLRRTGKLAFAPDRIYVTDTERHRLLAFDGSGKPLAATRTAPIALCFPNGIRVYDDGLLIADTNNHRIAWVDPAAEFASETYLNAVASPPVERAQCSDASKHLGERGDAMVNTLVDANTGGRESSRAHKVARAGRKWPSAVEVVQAPAGEAIWIIVANDGMRDGDVLVFDAASDEPQRVGLPGDADPVELAQLGDQVLITDPTNMKVYASSTLFGVKNEDPTAKDWQAPGLAAAFTAQREQRAAYRVLRFGATGGIGLGVLLALVVVVLEKKRENAAAVSGPARAVMRLDGAVPERLRVDRADGRLEIEYEWFGARERRMAVLAYGIIGVVAAIFLALELNALRDGDEFSLSMLQPLIFVLLIGIGGATFTARTIWRLDGGVLTWTTKPLAVMPNGSVARGEVGGIRLVSPPKAFGQTAKRGYALELVPRAGKPRRLMQGTERDLALWVGGTLAKALGLDGVNDA